MTTAKGIYYLAIHVADLQRSKRFYVETLGWTLGTDEPFAVGVSFGAAYLVLLPDASGERSREASMHAAVLIDDLTAEHARLQANGVTVSTIVTQPWGETNFTFHDPDCYLWVYSHAMKAG